MDKKYCVIIDAISTGQFIAPELNRRGFPCLHIRSTAQALIFYERLDLTHYAATFTYEDNLDSLVQQLSAYPIACVIPGTELGVELADALSEALGLITNGTALSQTRRDKFLMAEALDKAGLHTIPHIRTNNIDTLMRWAKAHPPSQTQPLVIKPLKSAGTDSVSICSNEKAIQVAFQNMIGSTSAVGTQNDEVLAQTFIDADEYVVNTVSLDGKHYISDIWRYRKKRVNEGGMVYDTMALLPWENEARQALAEYIYPTLDALGIKHGAAHSEIFVTHEGPLLVEVNARLMGFGLAPEPLRECLSHIQMDLLIDAYTDPAAFAKHTAQPYNVKKNMLYIGLIAPESGQMIKEALFAKIGALESIVMLDRYIPVGKPVKRTIDLLTLPAAILLAHEDPEQIEHDYQIIRALEASGLYE